MLHVERVDTLEKLEDLKKSWDELLVKCPSGDINLFLTHEWVSAWWAYFGAGKDLYVLLVKDKGELLAIAPMMIGRENYSGLSARVYGFLSNKHTSRADFIVSSRKQEVFAALVKYFYEILSCWDVLRLVHLPRESGNMSILEAELKKSKLRCFPVETSNTLCYLSSVSSWEEYLNDQPGKIRKKIKHYQNQLAKANDPKFLKETNFEDADNSMERLFSLERSSWKSSDRVIRFSDDDIGFCESLARKFAKNGGFHNRFLYIDGNIVGGQHYLIYNRIAYGILMYYDESFAHFSVGANLIINFMKDLMGDNSLGQLDFNGDSSFLRTWTSQCWILESISVCNSKPYSRLIAGLKGMKRFVRGRVCPVNKG